MCCCNYKFAQLETPLLLRLSSFNPPPPPPPQFVFFRVRPVPVPVISIRSCSFNDAVSTMPYDQPATCLYELLGIPQTGSLLEIKQAYKQLARKYHPDVSPPGRVEEYTRTFIRVQEAYETLSDPTTRELYDRHKAKGIHLAFTARRRNKFQQEMVEKSEWKNRWQSQVSELKRRSMNKDSSDNMSWSARIRKERNESSS